MATAEMAPPKEGSARFILRALRHRNYRLFFSGQIVSLSGTWMQTVAQGWLVYRLTNSPFLLGVVSFASQVPSFFIAPFAGVLADRWNRRKVLVITQTLAMLQAFILAALVLSGHIQVWHIICLSLSLGLINSFDFPMRQSFMIEMLENKDDLSNAIALNSSMVNGARLIGPSIAGFIIAAVGEGMCFLLNGLSYIGVIIALMAMRVERRPMMTGDRNVFRGLKSGIRYAFSTIPIRSILILLAFISLIGFSYSSLLPIFARDVLHGDSRTLGFLMAATGVGALLGAVYMAARKNALGLGRILAGASGLLGLGLILMSLSKVVWLSIPVMFLIGLGMILQIGSCNTILQTLVDEDKRGRVVSLYIVAFTGMVPYGNLLAGSVASAIGAPHTMLINGILCIVASVIFAMHLPKWREHVRPIYVSKGLLPQTKVVANIDQG